MAIDVKALHPQWRMIHDANITQLQWMIRMDLPQSGEARELLQKALADKAAIEAALAAEERR